jgi:hypothetical protein
MRNLSGQQIYYAFESDYCVAIDLQVLNLFLYFFYTETDTCMNICCEAQRGFTIHVVDNFNIVCLFLKNLVRYFLLSLQIFIHIKECLRISREFKCFAGNKWCAGWFVSR